MSFFNVWRVVMQLYPGEQAASLSLSAEASSGATIYNQSLTGHEG